MNSIPATPSGSSTAANRTQYHHFIPRLILRGFRQDSNNSITTTLTRKQKRKLNNSDKDGLLHFIQTSDGTLGTNLLSTHYGMEDMYRDMHSVNQYALEEELSKLESKAGEVLAKARKTFVQPGALLTLSRPEKDVLRRFLFIMKYRNSHFFSRFNVATIDEYKEDDKEKMRKYMQKRHFKSPKEVWFDNMAVFLKVHMDPRRNWHKELQLRTYPDDALLFILHVEQSYIAFCKPQCVNDEFLLTDNVFGIFEGPNSMAMDPVTGQMARGIWTEWHNFAPVSASLLMVLRSVFLPGSGLGTNTGLEKAYRTLLAMHPYPERAVSILQDLPVRCSTNSYSSIQSGKIVLNPDFTGFSSSDYYTFQCFGLESKHVNLINSVFLEEATTATTVTYKSKTAAMNGIRTYLEEARPGFKAAYTDDSPMYRHIHALETALQKLGGTARTHFTPTPLPFLESHPLDYAGHMSRWVTFYVAVEIWEKLPELKKCYQQLGGPSEMGLERWYDMEQAGKVLFLHIKIDSALSMVAATDATKQQCQFARQEFFASLHPRIVWLYVKGLRNLNKFDENNFERLVHPLQCKGLEDDVARGEFNSNVMQL